MMNQKNTSLNEFDNTLVRGVPCSIYGSNTDDTMVWVRHSDGAAIPLTQSEAHLLSRMSTVKTVGDWLETLCRDAVQDRLKDGKHPIIGRILEWTYSFTEDANEGATKQYRHLPLYSKYSKAVASSMERGLLAPVEESLRLIMEARTPSVENCRITTLCIPTCGRSEYLSRCVSSFSRNLYMMRKFRKAFWCFSLASLCLVTGSALGGVQAAAQASNADQWDKFPGFISTLLSLAIATFQNTS